MYWCAAIIFQGFPEWNLKQGETLLYLILLFVCQHIWTLPLSSCVRLFRGVSSLSWWLSFVFIPVSCTELKSVAYKQTRSVWTHKIAESTCKLFGNNEFPLRGHCCLLFAKENIQGPKLHKFFHHDVCKDRNTRLRGQVSAQSLEQNISSILFKARQAECGFAFDSWLTWL